MSLEICIEMVIQMFNGKASKFFLELTGYFSGNTVILLVTM
jgi:hypothetical protein